MLVASEVEVDVQVRLVDQLQIIEFGKLNHVKRELLAKMEVAKKEKDTLEDAEEMVMLADSTDENAVRVLLGDAFVVSDSDAATELVGVLREKNAKKLTDLEAELAAVQARQAELKTTLYGRFKSTINLEDE